MYRRSNFLRTALIAGCLAISTECRADVFDVYIAAGQSNMDGRGLNSDLVGPLASYATPQPDVLLYFSNPRDPLNDPLNRPTYSSGGWVALQPGFAIQPGFPTGGTVPATRFGPEVSFGRAMANLTPDRRVAIIKVSRGGESLSSSWDPSDEVNGPKGYLYHGFEEAYAQAIQDLKDQGHSVEVRGVLWHHGSADSASSYEANLREFIDVIRNDVGQPNLPFLIGELAGDTENRLALRAIQANVAATTDFAGFVPSDGLVVASDGIHFTAPGVIELGQRFAATMQTTMSRLAEDYNRDGIANAQDYDVWRSSMGSTTNAQSDANNDGVVDAADYVLWRKGPGVATQTNVVQFTFPDTSPFDAGDGTTYTQGETKDGLSLTTVDVRAPKYVVNPQNSSQLVWDGETYVSRSDTPAVWTNVSGSNGLGIDNPTITSSHFTSESQNIHPDESWTFKFGRDVILQQIEFVSLGSTDRANVTVAGLTSVDYVGGGDVKNNPFGSLLIPANTTITFTNSADSITMIDGMMSGLSIWRIRSLTVQAVLSGPSNGQDSSLLAAVPEPAAFMFVGSALVGFGIYYRRRCRKTTVV